MKTPFALCLVTILAVGLAAEASADQSDRIKRALRSDQIELTTPDRPQLDFDRSLRGRDARRARTDSSLGGLEERRPRSASDLFGPRETGRIGVSPVPNYGTERRGGPAFHGLYDHEGAYGSFYRMY